MTEFLLFLLVAAAFLTGLKWLVRYSNRRIANRVEGYREIADRRGWQIEQGKHDGLFFRINGFDSVKWQLETDSDAGSSDPNTSTKWSTNDIDYPDLVGMIRTGTGVEMLQSSFGEAASRVLNMMVRLSGLPTPQHTDLIKTGHRINASSSVVNENFIAIVRDNVGLDKMFTRRLEAALAAWTESDIDKPQRDSLSIDIGQTNLRVYCQWIVEPEHIERFVEIGCATADALRSSPNRT